MCGVWRGYDVEGVGGGEFALQLVSHQRVDPLYWRSDTHTHTSSPGLLANCNRIIWRASNRIEHGDLIHCCRTKPAQGKKKLPIHLAWGPYMTIFLLSHLVLCPFGSAFHCVWGFFTFIWVIFEFGEKQCFMILSLPLKTVCQPRVSGEGGFRRPVAGQRMKLFAGRGFGPNARLQKD
jgi:hypothetical protein